MDERTVSAALSFQGAVKILTNYSAGSQQTEFSTQGADLLFFSVFKKIIQQPYGRKGTVLYVTALSCKVKLSDGCFYPKVLFDDVACCFTHMQIYTLFYCLTLQFTVAVTLLSSLSY